MFWDTDPKSNLPVKMKLIVTSQCFIMVLDMASRDGIIVCRVLCFVCLTSVVLCLSGVVACFHL